MLQDEGDERSLARKSERLQEDPQRFVDPESGKVERLDERFQDREVLAVRQIVAWKRVVIFSSGKKPRATEPRASFKPQTVQCGFYVKSGLFDYL